MPHGTAHEWYTPRLKALIAEAEAQGIARDVSVAVVTDLISGPLFSNASIIDDEGWNQDPGEPDGAINPNEPLSAEPGHRVSEQLPHMAMTHLKHFPGPGRLP